MEQKTIGKFLSALRKANGYTQQQVADFLCVSNKTVSKWECDDGYPEITMLPAIAELYNVTVDEILKGERIDKKCNDNISQKIEERSRLIIDRANLHFNTFSLIAIILGCVSIALPLGYFSYIAVNHFYDYDVWRVAVVCSILLIIASLIIAVIGGTKYSSALILSTVEKETLNTAKRKLNLFYSVELFLSLSAVVACFSRLLYVYWTMILIYIAFVIALLIYYLLNKKFKDEPNGKILSLQKKAKKVTVAIAITVILSGIIVALICALFESTLFDFWYIYFDAYMLQTIIPSVCILPTISYVVYCLLKRKIEN